MNPEPKKDPPVSDYFRKMATAIDHNAAAGFGGAFVIIPPEGGGNPIETLILDEKQDPAQFWTLLKTKCDTQIALADQALRTAQAGFRR
jgi:hypothetical protein